MCTLTAIKISQICDITYKIKIMSLSPQVLLSKEFRGRFVANFKDLSDSGSLSRNKSLQNASVLIPICVRHGKVHILYTLRSSNLKNHSGQVSFPGGKADEGESFVDTALRETEEEIGVPRNTVDVWTVMPQFQGLNKDLVITPVAGEIKKFDFDKLIPNKDEVEEVFTVPIDTLCNTSAHGHFMYGSWPIPLFMFENHKIWGITGLITNMFLMNFLPSDVYNFNFDGPRFDYEDLRQPKL